MTEDDELRIGLTSWATYLAIATCSFFYMYFLVSYDQQSISLTEVGAATSQQIWKGEIWRLFFANFVHLSLLHLLLNLFVLSRLGHILEPLIGGSRFLFIFVLSGAAGFALSILVGGGLHAGSTGSLFGLVGGLLGARLNLKKESEGPQLSFPVLVVLCASTLFCEDVTLCFLSHGAAFVVGLSFGFVFITETKTFQAFDTTFKKPRQKAAIVVLLSSLVFSLLLIGISIKPVFLVRYHVAMAFDAVVHQDLGTARSHADWLEANQAHEASLYTILTRISAQIENWDEARGFARLAISHSSKTLPEFFQANVHHSIFADPRGNAAFCEIACERADTPLPIRNDCAWLLLRTVDERVHDPKQALSWILVGVKENPNAPASAVHTLAEAYAQNGMKEEALHTIERGFVMGDPQMKSEFEKLERKLSKD